MDDRRGAYYVHSRLNRTLPNFPLYCRRGEALGRQERFLLQQEKEEKLVDAARQREAQARLAVAAEKANEWASASRPVDRDRMERERVYAAKCLLHVRRNQLRQLLEEEQSELDAELRKRGITIGKERL